MRSDNGRRKPLGKLAEHLPPYMRARYLERRTKAAAPAGRISELAPQKESAIVNTQAKQVSGQKPHAKLIGSGRPRARSAIFCGPSFLELQHRLNDLYCKLRKLLLRIQDIPSSSDGRHIAINEADPLDERTGAPYIGNSIRSTRYTLLTFFPRQLFAQFSKLANFYFLVIGIMQMIPRLSTTGRFTTIVPLLVFVGISMGKEGWDDLRRWKLDQEENNRLASVFELQGNTDASLPSDREHSDAKSGAWVKKRWADIKVGNVIRLERDDPVPADMVLLHAEAGSAYMETMALDGETSLKNKRPPGMLVKSLNGAEDAAYCHGEIVVEDPSIDLYRFEGKITVAGESLPLTTTEVLLRGSTLRNTPTAVGLVCYTGEECRIRQNANKNPRIKAPALQSLVNRIVVLIATFVLLLSLGCAFGYTAWDSYEDNAWFLRKADVYWGYVLTSFIIMFNTLLPLSLYVSMEIIKLVQVWLMNGDLDMYEPNSDTPMDCHTSTINEELGQISYIFTDKTGTLTKNEMKVQKLSCGGQVWNQDSEPRERKFEYLSKETEQDTQGRSSISDERTPIPSVPSSSTGFAALHNAHSEEAASAESQNTLNREVNPNATKDSISPAPKGRSLVSYWCQYPDSLMARKTRFLILSIALCHTCLPEQEKRTDKIKFQATSPDELALVTAAQEVGYLVINREQGQIQIRTWPNGPGSPSVLETYKVLQVIEFTSSRKRMSVIVREPNGRICVHCKGADSVVRTLLHHADAAERQMKSIAEQTRHRRSLEAQLVIQRRSSAFSHGELGRDSVLLKRSSTTSRPVLERSSTSRIRSDSLAGAVDAAAPSKPPVSSALCRSSSTEMELSTTENAHKHNDAESPDESFGKVRTGPGENGFVSDALLSDKQWVMQQTFTHVDDFANEGLRTLLHAARYVQEDEYQKWAAAYSEAATALTDREKRISEAANLIEEEFELIGATAIEDKLQDGVPDSIDRLRRANIKLWMLTGDKRETAISIARSCSLAKDYSTFLFLDRAAGDVGQQLSNARLDMSEDDVAHVVLVLDGETLASISDDAERQTAFLELAVLVDAIICCRASPSQKAMLVKSIRHHVKRAITLAIGDGANDVAMIQEADVGIGISGGKEGAQAARTSDYAIAQFRFLCKLLLVHGRYNYDRVSKYILATMYKEMVFYMTQALYQRYNGYTGTSLYENWSLSWYNAFFTSLPVIFLGSFLADLSQPTLLAVPELYTKGQRRGGFNFKLWLWWMFLGSAEAMLVYFVMHSIYAETPFTLDNGIYAMGVLTYTACIIIVNLKLQAIEVHNKNILVVVAIGLSLLAWVVWNLLIAGVYEDNVIYHVKDGLLDRFGRNSLWWLTLLLTILAFLLFEISLKSLRATFLPSDVNFFQVYEQDPELRKRFESSAASLLPVSSQAGPSSTTRCSSSAGIRDNSPPNDVETALPGNDERVQEQQP